MSADINDVMADLREMAESIRDPTYFPGFGFANRLDALVDAIQDFLERQFTLV